MKVNKPVLVLIVTALASFLATFNETFLNIAFTPIMKDFGIGVNTVSWLTTAYLLGAAICVPIASYLFKKYPTKPLFLITVGFLIVGSVICAFSSCFSVLLIGRIIQSIGTGLLVPIGMNITLTVIPKEKIGTCMGIMGAMTTLGPSLSIISAGAILSVSSWHVLFYVFAVLSTILFLSGILFLGKGGILAKVSLDKKSVIAISFALIGLLYGISTIFTGNILIALIAILVGIVSIVIFIKRQRIINNPLINLDVLKIKPFAIGMILNMITLMLIFALNIITPLYLQNALKVSAFSSSLALFPAIISSCIMAPISGKIFDKNGAKRIVPLGFCLMFIFIIALIITTKNQSLILFTLLYIPIIIGTALIIGPIQSFALSSLKQEQNPDGVTLMSTGFQVAGCLGSSLFTGTYSLVFLQEITKTTNYNALTTAFIIALLMAAIISLIAFILSLKIKKMENKKTMVKNYLLESIMKKDVYTILDTDSLETALKTIITKKISGVPVLNKKEELVGFISDGDILRYLAKNHPFFINVYSFLQKDTFDEKLKDLMKLRVKDIIKKKIITIDLNTEISEVCSILNNNHLKKAPVMKDGKMIGIVNRSNITKYVVNNF